MFAICNLYYNLALRPVPLRKEEKLDFYAVANSVLHNYIFKSRAKTLQLYRVFLIIQRKLGRAIFHSGTGQRCYWQYHFSPAKKIGCSLSLFWRRRCCTGAAPGYYV